MGISKRRGASSATQLAGAGVLAAGIAATTVVVATFPDLIGRDKDLEKPVSPP